MLGRWKSVAGDNVLCGVWWEEKVPASGLRWRSAAFTKEVSEASISYIES